MRNEELRPSMAAGAGTNRPEHGGEIRPLNLPRPVTVEVDGDGVPAALLLGGRLRGVRAVHDRWRIDDEWWRSEISRCYWEVETEDGRRLTVYQDLVSGEWFEQGYGVVKGESR